MRLLIVNPSPIRGGAEQMLSTFARSMDPARVAIEVACLAPGPFPDELRAEGAVVHQIDAGRMRELHRWAATVRKLAALARGFDAVCSWQVKGHYYGTPAARLARVPSLWWDHGIRPASGEPHAFAAGSIPKGLHADLVLTSSRAAAGRHRSAVPIHPGIDLEPFDAVAGNPQARADARASLGVDTDATVVGIVGRLQPWKGQHVFLRAAARVAPAYPSVRFVIVGDATGGFSTGYPAELRALADELGISEKVVFAGERRDIAAVLPAFEIFVHASTDEPFGIVIVEALAAGVPVVATRGGGVPEIISDGENGMLVSAGDEGGMADAINRLLGDDALRERFVVAGRARAKAEFSAARMVADFTGTLETLVATSRRTASSRRTARAGS